MSEVKIQVQGIDDFFADTTRAARRIAKGDRTPQPASISFTSSEEVFGLLTPNRWRLPSKLRTMVRRLSASSRERCSATIGACMRT